MRKVSDQIVSDKNDTLYMVHIFKASKKDGFNIAEWLRKFGL